MTAVCVLVLSAVAAIGGTASVARAQVSPAPAPQAVSLPEPIYWKQTLFLIPYQWTSAADPGAAQAVLLYVSRDRGVSWQKISEAKPQVKAFNYRADGDGEYWFAIRTVDRYGQPLPAGPYVPELRVVVDTTMPRIEILAAQFRSDGAIELQWRGSDLNLDENSWRFEAQFEGAETWHAVAVEVAGSRERGAGSQAQGPPAAATLPIFGYWRPPGGSRPRAVRATVYDRAGNSASYGAVITGMPAGTPVAAQLSTTAQQQLSGWVSSSDGPPIAASVHGGGTTQSWPADAVSATPFRLSAGAGQTPGDGVTSYGNPAIGGRSSHSNSTNFASAALASQPPVQFGYAAAGQLAGDANASPRPPASSDSQQYREGEARTGANFAPLAPFRAAAPSTELVAVRRLPAIDGSQVSPPDVATVESSPPGPAESATNVVVAPAGVVPKRVGSRKFALEYELDDVGRWGIAKVELWGTRDGGQTWRSYATDDDSHSPIVVSVDSEGLYGFRIVVESAGGGPANPPRAGDVPELWVDVDLRLPVVELTSIEPGSGELAEHLILRWNARDENLESRPISLFYSTRPAGPWSAIATNLTNSGEYEWQMQRYVPERFYVRIEARDTAGNLAAFQTREPVALAGKDPTGRLRDVEAVGPTAASVEGGYR